MMILNNIELIETELGKIPVIVNKVNKEGNVIYHGRMIYDEIKIFIETPTKESCMIGLTNAFEQHMEFWLQTQLTTLNIWKNQN